MARTQNGNNNVYCQDNELAWVNWDQAEENADLVSFTRRLLRIRANHPVFRRRQFLAGGPLGADVRDRDIAWLVPNGTLMTQDDWDFAFGKSLQVFFNGDAIEEPDYRGQKIHDDSFILMFNAHFEPIDFTLPPEHFGMKWKLLVDTTEAVGHPLEDLTIEAGGTITVPARSTMLLRQVEAPDYTKLEEKIAAEKREQELAAAKEAEDAAEALRLAAERASTQEAELAHQHGADAIADEVAEEPQELPQDEVAAEVETEPDTEPDTESDSEQAEVASEEPEADEEEK